MLRVMIPPPPETHMILIQINIWRFRIVLYWRKSLKKT